MNDVKIQIKLKKYKIFTKVKYIINFNLGLVVIIFSLVFWKSFSKNKYLQLE